MRDPYRFKMACIGISILIIAGSCQRLEGQTGTETGRELSPASPSKLASLYAWGGINELIHKSQAIVTAEVLAVDDPSWNSKDGSEWTVDPDSPGTPIEFRYASVRIQEVHYSSQDLSPAVDQELRLWLFGSGRPEGERVDLGSGTYVYEGQIQGPFEAGESMLLLLAVGDYLVYRDGERERVVQPVGGFQGVWTIRPSDKPDGPEMAVSIHPLRTHPVERLLARFREERAVGRNPARDANTKEDPLGPPG